MSDNKGKSLKDSPLPGQDTLPNPDSPLNLPHKIPGLFANSESVELIEPEIQIGLLRNELQESRDKYLILYDYAPAGYVTLNSKAQISEANQTLNVWLGVEKETLIGSDFSRYIASGDQEIFHTHLRSVLSGKLKQKCDLRLKKKNGLFLAVLMESIAIRDSRGNLSRCFCTLSDSSRLHKQLELESIHKTISEISLQATFATDKNLVITQWNKSAEAAFGWTAGEIKANPGSTRIRLSILEPLIGSDMMRGLSDQGEWSGNVTCQRKDGSRFVSQVVVGVIWDNSGNFNGLVAVFNRPDPTASSACTQIGAPAPDIKVLEKIEDLTRTNQILQQELNLNKQAALAARESEGKNRDLVDNIKLGIFRCTTGPNGHFLEVNKAMEEISGFTREELLQLRVCDLYSSYDDLTPFDNEVNINDWKVTRELNLKKKDGNLVTVAVTVVAIRFDSGATQYCDGILEDITERKHAQMQINQSLNRLQKTIKEIIEAMAYIGEVRDPYTAGHQRRVAQLSLEIGKSMGLREEQNEGLTMAAFVHDIGKILVPSDILSKPGKLTRAEYDMLRDHTRIGYEILKTIEFPWPIAKIVLQHHERLDGSGYPHGLKGDQIVIEARILAVADVVEAMFSHRPYRPALGIDKALDEIIQNRGTLYDTLVVDNCLHLFQNQGYDLNQPVLS